MQHFHNASQWATLRSSACRATCLAVRHSTWALVQATVRLAALLELQTAVEQQDDARLALQGPEDLDRLLLAIVQAQDDDVAVVGLTWVGALGAARGYNAH